MRQKAISTVIIHTLLILLALVFLFPVLVTVTNSFMSMFEITNRFSSAFLPATAAYADTSVHYAEISLMPTLATLQQYIKLFFEQPLYFGLFLNSIKITVPVLIGHLLISVPAAYGFEIAKRRWTEVVFFVYVVIMLLPLQLTLVPNYMFARAIGIDKSVLAIILPGIFNPFGVFLIRQYCKGMPPEYTEAARVDGANDFQAFIMIITPMVKPAIAVLTLLTFIDYWNVVDQAVVFLPDPLDAPLSVALSGMGMDLVFAASCFYMLPCVLVFLYGQEYLSEGIQLSGIK